LPGPPALRTDKKSGSRSFRPTDSQRLEHSCLRDRGPSGPHSSYAEAGEVAGAPRSAGAPNQQTLVPPGVFVRRTCNVSNTRASGTADRQIGRASWRETARSPALPGPAALRTNNHSCPREFSSDGLATSRTLVPPGPRTCRFAFLVRRSRRGRRRSQVRRRSEPTNTRAPGSFRPTDSQRLEHSCLRDRGPSDRKSVVEGNGEVPGAPRSGGAPNQQPLVPPGVFVRRTCHLSNTRASGTADL